MVMSQFFTLHLMVATLLFFRQCLNLYGIGALVRGCSWSTLQGVREEARIVFSSHSGDMSLLDAWSDSPPSMIISTADDSASITIAVTLAETNQRSVFLSLAASTTWRQLRQLLKDIWLIPRIAQHFQIDNNEIDDWDLNEVRTAFVGASARPSVYIVTCIVVFSYTEQQRAHVDLLRAIEDGSVAEVSDALSELYPKRYPLNANRYMFNAVFSGRADVVQAMISAKADVEKVEFGTTPACMAAKHGHVDVLRVLISAKADFDQADCASMAPIHFAAQFGHTDILQILISAKSDVDKATKDGCTPLHISASNGRADMVKMLTNARADVEKENASGLTPIAISAENGHVDVLEALVNAKVDVDKLSAGLPPTCISEDCGHAVIPHALCVRANVDKGEEASVKVLSLEIDEPWLTQGGSALKISMQGGLVDHCMQSKHEY